MNHFAPDANCSNSIAESHFVLCEGAIFTYDFHVTLDNVNNNKIRVFVYAFVVKADSVWNLDFRLAFECLGLLAFLFFQRRTIHASPLKAICSIVQYPRNCTCVCVCIITLTPLHRFVLHHHHLSRERKKQKTVAVAANEWNSFLSTACCCE